MNASLIVILITMQVWIGVSSSVLGVLFLVKFLSCLSTYAMFQNVTDESAMLQSLIKDKEWV